MSLIIGVLFLSNLTQAQNINLDSLEQILKTEQNITAKTELLINLANQYYYVNASTSEKYIVEALELAKKNKDKALEIEAKGFYVRFLTSNTDSAILMINECLDYCKGMEVNSQILEYYNVKGWIYMNAFQFEKSEATYIEALKLIKEENSSKRTIYYNLANTQAEMGKVELAYENFFNALKIAEANKDSFEMSFSYSGIGGLFHDHGAYENALSFFDKALDCVKDSENLNSLMYIKQGIAAITASINQRDNENFEACIQAYEEVLKLAQELDDPNMVIRSQLNLFINHIYNNSSNVDSLFRIIQGMSHVTKDELSPEATYFTVAMVQYYKYKKNYSVAINWAKKALQIAEKKQTLFYIVNLKKTLSELYYLNKQPDLAYQYLLEHKTLNDSIFNQNQVIGLKLKEAEFNFEQKEAETEQAFQAEKETQRRINQIELIFLAILSVVICFLIFTIISRNKLSKQLRKKNEELSDLNETKTRFFANISHELKTPLTLIISPLQKLKQHQLFSNEELYLLKTAEKNSLELLDLTNQILELTKFEVNKVDVHLSDINLFQSSKMIFANFESLASNRKIDFQIKYIGDESLMIRIDEYKLQTILKNLISNALKFTVTNDRILMTVTEQEKTIEIEVSDTGRGIHPQDLSHVFDRYFQTNMNSTLQEGGTGIGLTICKEYSKILGGDIEVQSKFGEGTTFKFYFPKVIAQNITTQNTKQLSKVNFSVDAKEVLKENLNLPSILLVEDNLDMQEYIQFVLQTHFNVLIAPNGKLGLEILETQATDIELIISDVMMPVMNGYEFVEKVKEDSRFATIPVIMLTALNDVKSKLKGLRIGIDDYLLKPFVEEELIARIENLIANNSNKIEFQLAEKTIDTVTANPSDTLSTEVLIDINKADLLWLENLEEIVQLKLTVTDYTIDDLAFDLAISRSALYRKLKAVTGLTPNSYFKEVRLNTALLYLENNQYSSVKAVAYEVGFKDEKYFSREFKKRFGKNPSEYL